ncbi:hypothetical protein [Cupriavidus metallidurans]|uniref:hypothetical protein n=1 Tax=Cupriavidus metallidurans TaxID=119219 RepID=UPI0035C6AFBD
MTTSTWLPILALLPLSPVATPSDVRGEDNDGVHNIGASELDSTIRSILPWSHNDPSGDLAVMVAAAGVFASGRRWLDLAVGALIAPLDLWAYLQTTQIAIEGLQGRGMERDLRSGATVEGLLP